jgi:[FeFe] hydrogenase H-cluster maturation GTPase HydF
LVNLFEERAIPFIVALNKSDLAEYDGTALPNNYINVSAKTGANVNALKELIGKSVKTSDGRAKLLGGLIREGDTVVLIMPQDSAAPKGRLILPEQQIIRDILDINAVAVSVRTPEAVQVALDSLKTPPTLVITDSQAFKEADLAVPQTIPLTSFSMLFARYNGILEYSLESVDRIADLQDGDKVLICEGCTHHRQCDDIGTVKLPNALRKFTGKDLQFTFTSGGGFPDNGTLKDYKICIHCGGCMLPKRAVLYRLNTCKAVGVPFTNYGVALAFLSGILPRARKIFNI